MNLIAGEFMALLLSYSCAQASGFDIHIEYHPVYFGSTRPPASAPLPPPPTPLPSLVVGATKSHYCS